MRGGGTGLTRGVVRSGLFLSASVRLLLAVSGLAMLSAPVCAQEAPAKAAADAAAATPPATSLPPTPMTSGDPGLDGFAPLDGKVDWPTVDATTEGGAAEAASDVRYGVTVTGLGPLGLDDEFHSLSALWTRRNSVANLAQINRRIAEDRDLIDQLLRSVGHYGGSVAVLIENPARAGAPITVKFTVTPGPLYHFEAVSVVDPADAIGPNPAALVTGLLAVKPGDPVDAARVTAAQDKLPERLADAGYPFPVITKPEISIDHATRTATLLQSIDLGARAIFGTVHISGDRRGFSDAHLKILARFKPGDPYNGADREDLRRALIQTGLFGAVAIKPVANGPRNGDGTQTVDLMIAVEDAPLRTISASGGYSTGQGIRLEGGWTHRNLFPPEGALIVNGVVAEREQIANVELRRHNFRHRDQTLTIQGGLSAEEQTAFDARTFSMTAAIARESNIIWQKPWTYSLGIQALVTRQRDRSAPNDPNNLYYIIALPGSLTWDKSDNLLNPAKGFRLTGRASPEFTLRSGSYFSYVKAQIEATAYQSIGDVVLAGRVHLGSIVGASRGRIAPDRRFYAGGGGSVRGFEYQGVGPKDVDGSPTGGNSVTEASLEARFRFTAFGNDLGLVPFVDVGQVYESTLPKFNSLRVGAGIGLRYFTSFGPVRIDVATPVTRLPGDPVVAFYVSIGQAF